MAELKCTFHSLNSLSKEVNNARQLIQRLNNSDSVPLSSMFLEFCSKVQRGRTILLFNYCRTCLIRSTTAQDAVSSLRYVKSANLATIIICNNQVSI
jgi:hypothetical protein